MSGCTCGARTSSAYDSTGVRPCERGRFGAADASVAGPASGAGLRPWAATARCTIARALRAALYLAVDPELAPVMSASHRDLLLGGAETFGPDPLSRMLGLWLDQEILVRGAANRELALEAGMAALHWLVAGYGYDVTAADVLDAYTHTLAAAEHLGEGALARTGHAGYHAEPAARDIDGDVFKVVLAGMPDEDRVARGEWRGRVSRRSRKTCRRWAWVLNGLRIFSGS